mgnify:CR=1 FL=1
MIDVVRPVRDNPDTAEPDQALLRAVADGDRMAFRRLHDRYYTRCYRLAFRLVQRPDRASEVANDTMLAVWRGAATFEGRAKISTWIFGIVYRQSLKTKRFFRREAGQVDIEDRADIADEGGVAKVVEIAGQRPPSDVILGRFRRRGQRFRQRGVDRASPTRRLSA